MNSAEVKVYRNNLKEFIKFGVVGGSGVVVNSLILILTRKLFNAMGFGTYDVWLNLFGTQYNIRYFNLFVAIAFLGANLWNYQLNRWWTFKHSNQKSWLRGFLAFLGAGLVAFVITLLVNNALLHPGSPLALPRSIFDDSSGLRTRLYWANLIGVLVATPANFVINKLWAFRNK